MVRLVKNLSSLQAFFLAGAVGAIVAVAPATAEPAATEPAETAAAEPEAMPAAMEGRQLSDEQRAQIEQRFEETSARLNLTEDQKTALAPNLAENFEKREALMKSYGLGQGDGEKMSRREMRKRRDEMRKFRGEMETLRDETNAQLAEVLTEKQLTEWAVIQEENRERMRERIRNRG